MSDETIQASPLGANTPSRLAHPSTPSAEKVSRHLRSVPSLDDGRIVLKDNEKLADVGRVVERLADLLRHTFGHVVEVQKPARPRQLPANISVWVLEEILRNLSISADAAMDDQGLIRFCIERRTMTSVDECSADSGMFVHIAVTDDGKGMTRASAMRAIDPRFSPRASEVSDSGLASAAATLQQSGGFLTIESREGAGTTVNCYIPTLSEHEVGLV